MARRLVILILATLLLSGCPSSSSNLAEAEAPVGEVSISSIQPPDGTTGWGVQAPVQVVFDRDIDPETISTGNFIIRYGVVHNPGSVEYDPASRTATFTPRDPLISESIHTAEIAGGSGMWKAGRSSPSPGSLKPKM